ncbi:MAG TPA: DICT sensory domain-containing protein [Solirubrobacteraceae bacterium]|nr:DICT sensory domain-containing protein [Solirubrobacteraceae bacterium]
MSRFDLTIGDVVARTGVAEPTLRIWERRYGFPEPRRTESGHRRYSAEQAQLVERVLVLRQAGLSLPAAVARAQTPPDPEEVSLFSSLGDLRPELQARVVRKPILVALSRAIEDEMLARAEARVLFACFQREAFYRSSEARWRELAAGARVAVVFADFERARGRGGDGAAGEAPGADADGPAEVPISRRQPLAREWALIIYGGRSSISMVAREQASSNVHAAARARRFELIWTVDPEATRALAATCTVLVRHALPQLADRTEQQLAIHAAAPATEQARLTTAVMNRVLATLS